MTLELPAAIEPFLTDDAEWSDPGCYALELDGPHDDWRDHWDTKPPWWERATDAKRVLYVGAASNVLSRLEDHCNGDVRKVKLVQLCEIRDLVTVQWCDDPRDADEYNLGVDLSRKHPSAYVHQR